MSLTSNYAAIAARKPKGPTKEKKVAWRRPVKRSQQGQIQWVEIGNGKPLDLVSAASESLKTVSGGLPTLGKRR
jgi:hypothetical protein